VTHLVEEGFDLAVRIGALSDSSMIGVRLTEVRRVVVGSPAYLAAHGTPVGAPDLRRHRIVSFDGVGSTDEWRFGPDGAVAVRVAPRLRVNMAEAAIDAVERGAGLTRVLSYQVADRVRSGRLCIVLASAEPAPIPVSLVYPANRRTSANVQAFVRAARDRFARSEPF
jgi:DNA-binding transcriptional LysR family regulator